MDLDWLRTFLVAAEEENFRRASERLHLAQPTVSTQIDKLEQQLGAQLFERVGRTVRLSLQGRRFLAHARAALTAVQDGEHEIARLQQGYDQTIVLAVSPLVATTYLPRWIRAFSQRFPNVEFAVQVMESREIAAYLAAGHCDLGFSRMPSALHRVKAQVLYRDPVVAVAPIDGHDLDGPARTVGELLQTYPLLTHNHPLYWDDLTLAARRQYPALRMIRVSQVHVTVRFVEEAMGISFLPTSTVRRSLSLGSLVEVPALEWQLPVAHTYLLEDGDLQTEAASAFARFVREYMDVRVV